MPDPKQHASGRGWIETILRYIPGFKGYLEKGYRRESDRLLRAGLADRLQRGKQGINDYTLMLTNAGQLDQLAACEQTRARLDRLISRLRGSVSGYSGFFDFVQKQEDELDAVYEHDLALVEQVDALTQQMQNLSTATEQPARLMPQLDKSIATLEQQIDKREDMLRGLGP
jgi:hypothetical protein